MEAFWSSLVSSSIENSARKHWDNIVGMLFSIEQYWESCWVQNQSKSSIFLTAMMNVTFLFLFLFLSLSWQLEYKYNRESVHGENEEVWVLLTISVHTPDMSLHKGKENNRKAKSNLETFRAVNIKSCNYWSGENQTLTSWSVENQCLTSWSVENQCLNLGL